MAIEPRTAYSTTQILGQALLSAAMIVVVVVTFLLFDGEDAGFFLIVTAVAIAATWVVWRFDRAWARIVGIVATLAVAATVFFLAFGILQPFSPLEFLVGLAFVLGFLLSVIGGIIALVAGRRQAEGPTRAETSVRSGVLGLMGLAAVVSVLGFFFTRTTVSEAEAAGAVTIDMVDFEFEPFASSVSAGEKVLLTNSDAFAHDLTLEELDIYVHVGPGSDAIVDLSAAPPGTYDYFCSLHSDGTEGMLGTITIDA